MKSSAIAVMVAALCVVLACSARGQDELLAWQSGPSMASTDSHTYYAGLASLRRRTLKDNDEAAPSQRNKYQIAFVPRAAGLGATVVLSGGAPHLLLGTPVAAGSLSLEYSRSYPWRPLTAQWDAGELRGQTGRTLATSGESADWCHNRLSLRESAGNLLTHVLVLSRLTPAVLVHSWTGGFEIGLPTASMAMAVSDGRNVAIVAPGQAPEDLRGLERGWLLVFWTQKEPVSFGPNNERAQIILKLGASGVPAVEPQYRTPILILFSDSPSAIRTDSGLRVNFSQKEAKAVLMPLYGATALGDDSGIGTWAQGLPAPIQQLCDWWARRLCDFPVTATESYSYDRQTDTVMVTQTTSYETVRPGGLRCAPVPPMVALAQTCRLPLQFSSRAVNTQFRTAYGPYLLVEGVSSFHWLLRGLDQYVHAQERLGPPNPDSRLLEQELADEVDKVLAEPYLAPWVYETRRFGPMGDVYWRMPSETPYYLARLLPVLDQDRQEKVRSWLRAFAVRFPFLQTRALETFQGPRRERHDVGSDPYYARINAPDRLRFAVVRGLADYYQATGDKPDKQVWHRATELLMDSLKNTEWATGGWVLDKSPEPVPPGARALSMDLDLPPRLANRQLADLIGFLRLARLCGEEDSPAAALAWGQLARQLAYRLGLAGYAQWIAPPDGPTPFNARWIPRSGANEVRTMDQFGVNLWNHTQDWRWAVYIPYLELTAEVGRFLHDYARPQAAAFLNAVDRTWPQWWLANMTSEIGNDSSAGLAQPVNAYSLFMARAWILRDSPANLRDRLDVSWTQRGDFFYMHRLAETIKAYRGIEYSEDKPVTAVAEPQTIDLEAQDTLTAVEMNWGDTLRFRLRSGQVRTLTLERTSASIIYTNLDKIRANPAGEPTAEVRDPALPPVYYRGRAVYEFQAQVRIDGRPMTMQRYVCTQESYYEPYVINGLRIWFDGVSDIFKADGGFLTEDHGPCAPKKKARFVLQDMTLPICPQPPVSWYPDDENYIAIERSFNGDDPWMGAYLGSEAHGGLDVNMKRNSPHWAPIDLDDQWLYNAVSRGDNNNRWCGLRTWPDGSQWQLNVAHIVELTVPEHTPLKAGAQFAKGAGVACWWHDHAHFGLSVRQRGQEYLIDPWILMWQIFQNKKAKAGELLAGMAPLSPTRTGQPVQFSAAGTSGGAGHLRYMWSFGDGGAAVGSTAAHAFARPGIYPVTLTVGDGRRLAAFTQHITVDGPPLDQPVLALSAPDEPAFRARPVVAMDVYGWAPKLVPHTLTFVARSTRPTPEARRILLINGGAGTLGKASGRVEYDQPGSWLKLALAGDGNQQRLDVAVDGSGLAPGEYAATIVVDCPGAINSPQPFRVVLRIPAESPRAQVTIEESDPQCFVTPWFWVGHRFHGWGWPRRGDWMVYKFKEEPQWETIPNGSGHFYLFNGKRPQEGQFVRYTPDLAAGRYEIRLSEQTPFDPDVRFRVRIHHAQGDADVWVEPARSLVLGRFPFHEGADGFLEIHAAGSRGQVLADAVIFSRVGD